ncbi:MAG: PHB depolymerase family esterase [Pseudomonadota bacterium]
MRLAVGALERHYIVHVPPRLEAKPAVVLNFHGGGAHARVQQEYVRMDALADRERFLVVYPDGTGPLRGRFLAWNGGTCCGVAAGTQVDDVAFVRALLDDLSGRIAYDPERVYATGLSNGAMMSYRLAAELSDRVAAIAPVAGSMVVVDFAPRRPVPVMHIHSVDDRRALYGGGLGAPYPLANTRVLHPPVEEKLGEWARANGCGPEPEATERREWRSRSGTHTATRYAYPRCRAETVLWKLTGAGHVWPGGVLDYLTWLLGPGTRVIDANEEIWRFFSRHRLAK